MAIEGSVGPQKSNLPLFVGGCLVLCLACAGSIFFFFSALQNKVKNSGGYTLANQRAKDNDDIKQLLGGDFTEPGFLREAKYNVDNGVTTIAFTGTLKGSNGKEGELNAEATEEDKDGKESWTVTSEHFNGPDGKHVNLSPHP
jgi:hypothetical protein